MLPREKGHHSHSITASELRRGVAPKLVRQHILLILILRISDLLLLLLSCIRRVPIDGSPPGSSPWDSPGKNTGVDCRFLF